MKKLTHFTILCILLSLLAIPLAACGGPSEEQPSGRLEGNLTISGAWAIYPMMTRWAEEFQKVNPRVQFDISAGGAGKGMTDVLAGAVDLGMLSRDITHEEEARGAFWVAVTKDAVFPTINAQNPVLSDLLGQGITQQQLVRIFITGEIKTWGEVVGRPEITDQIRPYTRSDACGAGETWAKYLGKTQEDLLGVAVFGDPGLTDAVATDPLGIGYNNLGYAYDMSSGEPVTGITVLPLDANQNGQADPEEILETKSKAVEMVSTGKYPSPPARALNLVTQGKPTGLLKAFLEWILTEGQQYVSEAGCVQLTQEQLNASLQKIE